MLSNTCKYALRAIIYLALHAGTKKKIGIKKISGDLNIPSPFLGKILQILAKNKILDSTKGPNGGFGLGRDAKKVYLLEIVEIIDGLDSFELCIIGTKPCHEQKVPCAMHSRYAEVRDNIKEMFKSQSISDLVDDIKNGNQSIIL